MTSSQARAPRPDRTTAYARRVVAGEIVAGPHVRNACRRHLQDLEQGFARGLYFDQAKADRAFDFYERVLRLSEAHFEGQPFVLHESQCFIIGSIFGWQRVTSDGPVRRFRRAYIEQGKGNGKSPMAGGVGLYGMTSDGEAGAQVYSAASTRDQAKILFRDAVLMVKKSPRLQQHLKFSGGEGNEYNIAYLRTQSFFRPVSRETGRKGSGPRPYIVLADEVHELPDRTILETLERGFKFRRQPLIFMTTNSGSDRNSVCWEEHEHAVKVAAGNLEAINDPAYVGEVVDDSTFSYVCALDKDDDPLMMPECWVKANPLLGVTIQPDYLQGVVDQARQMPGKLNGILRLHFCVWTDAETAWMSRATLEPRLADFDINMREGEPCYIGIDLSQNRDITAMSCVVPTGTNDEGKPTYDAWVECWTPGDTVKARELRDKQPYSVWIQKGYLHAPRGETINYLHVAQTLVEYTRRFDVRMVAYDRYAFKAFEREVIDMGVPIEFVEHPQGGMRRGKPISDEIEGLWMPGSLRVFEEAILEGRVRLLKNPVLVSAIMSSVIEGDKWDNRWLSKERSHNKIDAAVALCMGFGAANTALSGDGDIMDFFGSVNAA